LKISFVDRKVASIKADAEIVFVVGGNLTHKWIKKSEEILKSLDFKCEDDSKVFLNESKKAVVAIDSINPEALRLAAASAIKSVNGDLESAKIALYLDKNDKEGSIEAICEGLLLGSYCFETYKSKKKEKKIKEVFISSSEYSNRKIDSKLAEKAIERGVSTAEAINIVRDIINTPPEDATPEILADLANGLAKTYGLECEIKDDTWIKEQGMGAFHAVGRASVNKPRLIHLTYKPKNPKAKVTLVGKGLTYDTGGLSLKPSSFMTTMKADKSGGITVLGIILAASRLGLDIEIHTIIGAAENSVSGNAYRPDDVLKAKNGKTIEVKNTDAEGRLVLADCLAYAQELKPDFIVDMATLTGACVVALGEYTFGVMGHSDELKCKMVEASKKSGELSHTLPFNKHLKKLLKSEVADISNVSTSRYGGAITAGLFLSEFIDEENRDKWLHLDIAGPAFVEKEWDFNPYGASGVGVRSVLTWLKSLSEAK
jgi:leucyl aminopeptidase